MKSAWICALLLYAFSVPQYVRAEEPDISRPRWVIIATVIDKTTGNPILQTELNGKELMFDSAAKCNYILQRIHPVSDEHLTVILRCLKNAAPAEFL